MKKILVLFALLLSSASLFAEPIGEERARQIAEEFFAQFTTRSVSSKLTLEWAGDAIEQGSSNDLSNSLMYIYNRGAKDGFVIVAGDNTISPIIAYSLDTTLDTDNMAEATEAILDAWCKQISNARKEAKPLSNAEMAITRAGSENLYETAIWNQFEPFNWEAPVYDNQRSVTGCVATAMSIICYYNRWPERGVGTTPEYSYTDYGGVSRTVAANTLGRTYNYSNMLADYNNSYTTTQGNAVAALMKDMGTSVKMNYHYTSSGAFSNEVANAMATYFGYSKAAKNVYRSSYPIAEWNEILRKNIDTYGPTFYSGQGVNGGHAFITDGYKGDYFHFNFGWGGGGNGYFLCPEIEYYDGQMAIFGLEPDRDGSTTFSDELMHYAYETSNGVQYRGMTSTAGVIMSNTSFNIRLGAFLNSGSTIFTGSIMLVLTDKDGNWKEQIQELTVSGLEPGYITWFNEFSTTITATIEEGDRLRTYFKGENNSEWQRMRSYDYTNCYDEIILRPTAQEIARDIVILYEKSAYELKYRLNYGHKISIENVDTGATIASGEFAGHTLVTLNAESFATNDTTDRLKFVISVGEQNYSIVIKL